VKKVVRYLANEYKDEIMGEINITSGTAHGGNAGTGEISEHEPARDAIFSADIGSNDDDFEDDEMYEGAREAVVSAGKASTSYIQRKLGIGYSRAAKLMDMLEERGVIGPANGSKPREVFGVTGGNDVTDTVDTIDHTETIIEQSDRTEQADSSAESETTK
jgi:S-DNA-T family DNA segregation ATPase FtsK/SpoIIIE